MIGSGLESFSSELFNGLDFLDEAWFLWHNFITGFCGSLPEGGVTDHPFMVWVVEFMHCNIFLQKGIVLFF
jgi:hypothetical protein